VNDLWIQSRKAVLDKINIASLTKEEREKYDESIKVYRDHLATLAYAEQKGIEKGERKHAIETAIAMKKDGLPLSVISKYTGLSEEEIERLD